MSNITTSALVGDPPNTEADYFIVRGLQRTFGHGPAGDPSEGFGEFPHRPSNYVHEARDNEVLINMAIVIIIILITTVPRVIFRASTPGMVFGSDDWAIILAACVAVVYPCIHFVIVAEAGGAQHIWEVTYEQFRRFSYWSAVSITIYYVAVGLIKISITLFLRRIAHQASRPWRIFCDIFLGTLVAYILGAVFVMSFQCTPMQAGWSIEVYGRLEQDPKCLDFFLVLETLTIIHVAQGIVLLCSPIIMLWQVRMTFSKKLRLFGFWTFGGITVLGGLLVMLLGRISMDLTYGYTPMLFWASIDICFGMFTASLPVLDVFIEDAWHSAARRMSMATGRRSKAELRDSAPSTESPSNRMWVDTSSGGGGSSVTAGVITLREFMSLESQERFVSNQSPRQVEMGILRTTDVEVRYSMAQPAGGGGAFDKPRS